MIRTNLCNIKFHQLYANIPSNRETKHYPEYTALGLAKPITKHNPVGTGSCKFFALERATPKLSFN